MRVVLNGEPAEIDADTLDRALAELGYGDAVVATALNSEFVPAPMRGEARIAEDDRIEIIAPMKGG
ncbi:thiamine biosynthesis protein ThiS [Fulvimarina pelagi HTCC2506]|uniref:Thiamine biosynthesis protein ThiS n=1 Tax=Fulvimarina pelagi HTCC2506 TaxID=314231 RepID=Q0G7W1_9HYPH|nr:sulfur carrier protein ThiS [Fulvimarina pelagi]EAU42253.1 thiamine biosynthesis protein ThiS [Fulvimarina pelagi HTCC2506]